MKIQIWYMYMKTTKLYSISFNAIDLKSYNNWYANPSLHVCHLLCSVLLYNIEDKI